MIVQVSNSKGKAQLSADGKRMRMRGYMGISILGRTQVWIRTEHANQQNFVLERQSELI